MIFHSIDEAIKHIEGCMEVASYVTAELMLEIMREEIQNGYDDYSPNIYARTGDLLNTPQLLKVSKDGFITSFEDNGVWYSLVGATKGQHFFALHGWENGTSWGRGASQPYEMSVTRFVGEVVPTYVNSLRGQGVPLR